jgi:hypothetical protein
MRFTDKPGLLAEPCEITGLRSRRASQAALQMRLLQ